MQTCYFSPKLRNYRLDIYHTHDIQCNDECRDRIKDNDGERDQRNAEGGGEEDQGELEGSRDWRTELGQAAGEAGPQRWRTVWTTRLLAR